MVEQCLVHGVLGRRRSALLQPLQEVAYLGVHDGTHAAASRPVARLVPNLLGPLHVLHVILLSLVHSPQLGVQIPNVAHETALRNLASRLLRELQGLLILLQGLLVVFLEEEEVAQGARDAGHLLDVSQLLAEAEGLLEVLPCIRVLLGFHHHIPEVQVGSALPGRVFCLLRVAKDLPEVVLGEIKLIEVHVDVP